MTPESSNRLTTTQQAAAQAAEKPNVPQCAADPDTIRAWLNSPDTEDGTKTVAERLDVDELFNVDDFDFSYRADALLREGQEAGVFGIPGHRISMVDLADKDDHNLIGHLLLVERPAGSRLASDYIDPGDLADTGQYGIDAAVSLYDNLADHVNAVLLQAERSNRAQAHQQRGLPQQVMAPVPQLDPSDTSPDTRPLRETTGIGNDPPPAMPQPQATSPTGSATTNPAGLSASSFTTGANRAASADPAAGSAAAGSPAAARISESTPRRRSQ